MWTDLCNENETPPMYFRLVLELAKEDALVGAGAGDDGFRGVEGRLVHRAQVPSRQGQTLVPGLAYYDQ